MSRWIFIQRDGTHTHKYPSHPQSERVKSESVSGTRSPLPELGQPGRNGSKCESVIVSERKRADLDRLELATRQEEGAKSSIVGYRYCKEPLSWKSSDPANVVFPLPSIGSLFPACQHNTTDPNKNPGLKQQPGVVWHSIVLEYSTCITQVCKISMERAQVRKRSTVPKQSNYSKSFLLQHRAAPTPSQKSTRVSTAAATAVVLHWYSCDAAL